MPQLVIFDFDGLMVNSEDVVYGVLQSIFAAHGHDFSWHYYSQHIGIPVLDSMRLFYADYPIDLPFEEFLALRNANVQTALASKLELMPGLLPLLKLLAERGMPMAIATSGTRSYVQICLERFGIAPYFQTVVCIDDVTRGKPHPDLLLKVLARTGVSNTEALILEDSPHGIEAATNAGVFSIAVPTRGIAYERFRQAGMIVENLARVHEMFALFLSREA